MPGFYDNVLVAHGAYDRDVKLSDWQAGKDFKIVGGPYFSIRDVAQLKDYGTTEIHFMNNCGFVEFVEKI